MTESPAGPDAAPEKPPEQQQRRASPWFAAILLVLLAGWFVVTQVVSRTGPEIEWIRDFATAQRLARERDQRVLLVLHEPDCPITAAHERDLFTQRKVRLRLAEMVPCRIELSPEDPLRRRFRVTRGQPMMVVLDPDGQAIGAPLEGRVDWLRFSTYVDPGDDDPAE